MGLPDPLEYRRLLMICRGRSLGFESKRAIGVNGDYHRDLQVGIHLRGFRIKCLAKLHDIDAMLSQRRANGGAGLALPAGTCSFM